MGIHGPRFGNLLVTWFLTAAAFGPAVCGAAESPLQKETYLYKRIGDCIIEADVYRADDAEVRPVVVWIHGGALIMGSRQGVPGRLLDLCRTEGFALVSLDYRLAPEVKLPAIIEDVQDAFRWICQEGPRRLRVDPKRMVVAGGSAGGYLTMMTGICVEPRPTALVAYWGYGDVDGQWYTRPSRYHGEAASLLPAEEMRAAVTGKPITGSDRNLPTHQARGSYYRYLRQNGLWTREVTGFDPDTERAKLDPYCPVRNVTSDYPPILMIHGTEDKDVPYEESAEMARQLARHHVPHELVTVPRGGHGLGGGDPEVIAEAHARALLFIKQQRRTL